MDASHASSVRFGRFDLKQEVAAGGMASVWIARTTGDGGFVHVCAVKRVHPHLAKQKQFVDMFLDEARIAARIQHPNVCRVFDFGLVEGVPYLAMEYLAGVSFSAVLACLSREPHPNRLVATCALVSEAAAGLHAAHELLDPNGAPLDVVHRDISPQNLFLTFDGVVKVVDFGIASARDKVHETQTGEVKGKFAYMAPEQMRGGRVDRRADVWSLGVVLWELCTLTRLFRHPSQPETMDAVLRGPIERPSARAGDVPKELDEVVLRALQREPEARFASARELATALDEVARSLGGPWSRAQLERWVEELLPCGKAESTALVSGVISDVTSGVVALESVDATKSSSTSSTEETAPDTKVERSRAEADPRTTPVLRRSPSIRGVALGVFALGALALVGLSLTVDGGRDEPTTSSRLEPRVAAPSSSPVRAEIESPVIATSPPSDAFVPSPPSDPATGSAVGPWSEAGTEVGPPSHGTSTEVGARTHRPAARVTRRSDAAPPTASATTPPPQQPPPRAEAPPPSAEGCVRVGLTVAARIRGERVDGPRVVRLPSGPVDVEILDPESGGLVERRSLSVPSGEACVRLTAR